MNATSISAEPNIVYRKNFSEAYWRFSPPHTPIMKYIGSSTTSKKTKNRIRSWATNVPAMPVCSTSIRMKNALALPGLGHVVPRVDHHQHGDDHRQDVQRQADAVEADRVRGLDRLDPLVGGEELQLLALVVVELDQRVDADGQRGDRGDEGDAAWRSLRPSWG